jgi:hypothetical protein
MRHIATAVILIIDFVCTVFLYNENLLRYLLAPHSSFCLRTKQIVRMIVWGQRGSNLRIERANAQVSVHSDSLMSLANTFCAHPTAFVVIVALICRCIVRKTPVGNDLMVSICRTAVKHVLLELARPIFPFSARAWGS